MDYADIPGIVNNDYAKGVLADFDSKIAQLRTRRGRVESKCLIRQKTIKEVVNTTNDSVGKLCDELQRDNQHADLRYTKILGEIDTALALTTSNAFLSGETGQGGVYNPYASSAYNASITSSKMYLQNAVKSYKKSVQLLLPAWKRQQVNSLEDEVKSIQIEKNSINYRKQVLFSEYERERMVKVELERERTQLILLRAQESAAQSSLYNTAPAGDISFADVDIESTRKQEGVYPRDFFAAPAMELPPLVLPTPAPSLPLPLPPKLDITDKENIVFANYAYNPPKAQESTPAKATSSSIASAAAEPSSSDSLVDSDVSMPAPVGIAEVVSAVPYTLEDFLDQVQTPSGRVTGSPAKRSNPPTPSSSSSPSKSNTAEAAGMLPSPADADSAGVLRSNVYALSTFECASVVEKLFSRIETFIDKAVSSGDTEVVLGLDKDSTTYFGYKADGHGGIDVLSKADAAIVDLVVSAARINRNAEMDTYDFRHWVAAASVIMQSRASDLVPTDAMNGLITLDKLKKEHKRLGPGRGELWSSIAMHIHNLSQIYKDDDAVDGLINAITSLLCAHTESNDAERSRVGRKVHRLLCGAAHFSGRAPTSTAAAAAAEPAAIEPAIAPALPPKQSSPPKLPPKTFLSYDKMRIAGNSSGPSEFDDEFMEREELQRPAVRDIDAIFTGPSSAPAPAKPKGKGGKNMAIRTVARGDLNDF